MYMNFKRDREPLHDPVYVQAFVNAEVRNRLDALAAEIGIASSVLARECIYGWSGRRYIARKHTTLSRECYINVRMGEKQKRSVVMAATHAGESTAFHLGSILSHGLALIY